MDEHLAEEQLLQLALHADPWVGAAGSAAGPVSDAMWAQHLSTCPACAARLSALRDELTQSLLQSTADAAPPAPAASPAAPPLKDRVLQATAPQTSPAALQGFVRRIGLLFDLDAATVQKLLVDALGETAWELPGPIAYFHFQPGARLATVAEAGVVRLAPGMTFPRHRHRGDEHGLVLTGTLRDDSSGKLGLPGDILFMPDGSVHTVTAVSDETCLFFVLLYGGTPDIEWC